MADIILVTLIHNRKEYLEEALLSAWNQTLDKSKFIHLLVDNNSTDGTQDIVQKFNDKHKHSNVRLIRLNTNLGIQGGHRFVIDNYVPNNCPEVKVMALLESDDLLVPEALQEVYNLFDKNPDVGETYSDFSVMSPDGRIVHHAHPKAIYVPNQFTDEGQRYMRNNFHRNFIGHLRAYNVAAAKDVGAFDEFEWANDVAAGAKILTKYKVIKINKVLYRWRDHSKSASAANSPEQTQQFHDIVNRYKKIWSDNGLL